MDFGKVADPTIINFTLPPKGIHLTHATTKGLRVYVGPPIWANRPWVGKIYPGSAKESEFLHYYCRQFNTIELNVTHYQIPTPDTIERWKKAATPGFTFCPKIPQVISHDRMLIGVDNLMNEFIGNVMGLEENLGVSFLQLGPTFAPKHFSNLENFIKKLPSDFRLSVEFRHHNWFTDTDLWKRTVELLHTYHKGLVITDVSGRRDVLHQSLSDETMQIRFVGNDLHPTDFERVAAWQPVLKQWNEEGMQELYVFIHTTDNWLSPELSNYWVESLNQTFGLALKPAQIQPQVVQGSLF